MKQKKRSPKSTLLADNTRGVRTTKQTKPRPVTLAAQGDEGATKYRPDKPRLSMSHNYSFYLKRCPPIVSTAPKVRKRTVKYRGFIENLSRNSVFLGLQGSPIITKYSPLTNPYLSPAKTTVTMRVGPQGLLSILSLVSRNSHKIYIHITCIYIFIYYTIYIYISGRVWP